MAHNYILRIDIQNNFISTISFPDLSYDTNRMIRSFNSQYRKTLFSLTLSRKCEIKMHVHTPTGNISSNNSSTKRLQDM